ncbi:plant intracellular Ras-group-related LRR protein 5-like [Rhodamnia argentea]|uniref:Plant intracellular Ras-group-related LRR protein 5-like n=1 Tax=Rhodamnia argentea TaxID=178133 RepID=A0A8B8NRB5_9MYRT|nr:plant intracellular Ras-group-related LRR protein 5-like [Rhodamnia argentea]
MAVIPKQDPPPPALVASVDEIARIYRSLPPRPTIEEVEAASSVLQTVDSEERAKLEEISTQELPKDVPDEVCSVLKEVRRNVVFFRSHEQKKEALFLVEVDRMFQNFDELIQRASELVSGDRSDRRNVGFEDPVERIVRESENSARSEVDDATEKESLIKMVKTASTKATISTAKGDSEKLSLMKVAALIENSAKTGAETLDLKGKLMDQIEWLPMSLGKLSEVTELDISENRIMALPSSMSDLRALTKLSMHSNQLINLPESFGELINLQDLDLQANRLRSLPDSFGNLSSLVNLNLNSNELTRLPDSLGNLNSLQTLNVESNELEELPYTIGSCSSLIELRLDFNQLKALPEAIGKIKSLEVLTLHYNRIKGLPTTMSNLSNLRELDVSFNELESVPETLSFAVSLEKLNIGSNFADLRSLPRSIGNLEMLEELDISNNQIRELPDSFRFLLRLRVLRAYETPLELPPREIARLGAQVVVQYMADHVSKRDSKSKPTKKKKRQWFRFGFWFCSGA